jgi:hypothetical protein
MNIFWIIVLIALAVIVAIWILRMMVFCVVALFILIGYCIGYLWKQITKTEVK